MWDPSTCTHPSQWQKTEESALLQINKLLNKLLQILQCTIWTDMGLFDCRVWAQQGRSGATGKTIMWSFSLVTVQPDSGFLHGILRDTSWFTLLWTDSSLWHCRSCLRHVENAMWDCHYRQVHHLEHNYKWLQFIQLRTLHMTREKKQDPSYLWRASSSSSSLALTQRHRHYGQFCSLWILTTKKEWRKTIFDAVLNRLIGELFICVSQKRYPFHEVIFRFDTITIILFFMRSGVVGGETLSPGWSKHSTIYRPWLCASGEGVPEKPRSEERNEQLREDWNWNADY
jgi:hypothetical protein